MPDITDAEADALGAVLSEGMDPAYLARVGDFSDEQIAAGELRAADAEAERLNRDLYRRAIAAVLEVRAASQLQAGPDLAAPTVAALSKLLFEAREVADMLAGMTHSSWPAGVRDRIDAYRAARGWSPDGFGREGGGSRDHDWTEVRLTGQPPGGYPPYDFTFCSDHEHWTALPGIWERAQGWTDVKAVSRRVHVETTEWQPWSP